MWEASERGSQGPSDTGAQVARNGVWWAAGWCQAHACARAGGVIKRRRRLQGQWPSAGGQGQNVQDPPRSTVRGVQVWHCEYSYYGPLEEYQVRGLGI